MVFIIKKFLRELRYRSANALCDLMGVDLLDLRSMNYRVDCQQREIDSLLCKVRCMEKQVGWVAPEGHAPSLSEGPSYFSKGWPYPGYTLLEVVARLEKGSDQ